MGAPQSAKAAPGWLSGVLAALALVPVFTRSSPMKVRTTTVERGPIRSQISTNGKVEPIRNFEAHSPAATTVKRVLVKEGDHVRQGQLLLELDDADLRSQAARAQAQMKGRAGRPGEPQQTAARREEVLTLDAQLIKARGARDSRSEIWMLCAACSNRAQLRRAK